MVWEAEISEVDIVTKQILNFTWKSQPNDSKDYHIIGGTLWDYIIIQVAKTKGELL